MGTLAFLDGLRQVGNEHRPVAFWFMNHFLREDELRRQVRELADKGFGGFMFHGRDGLRSGYLNGEWRQALAWSLDEASKLGLDAWLYDELNYPSGPAGNRIFDHCPDSHIHNLEAITATVNPGESIDLARIEAKTTYSSWSGVRQAPPAPPRAALFAFAMPPDGPAQQIPAGTWTNHGGHAVTVLALAEENYLSTASRFPDYLDPAGLRQVRRNLLRMVRQGVRRGDGKDHQGRVHRQLPASTSA